MRIPCALVVLAAAIASCDGGSNGSSTSIPDAFVGLHHRPASGATSAHNLSIAADGSATWQADGCDYIERSDLRATRDGDTVVLTAEDGGTFAFAGGDVQQVVITAEAGGLGLLFGASAETWAAGGVCPSCAGGSLVPVGPPVACEDPIQDPIE